MKSLAWGITSRCRSSVPTVSPTTANSYMRAKTSQEKLIRAGGISYTIVRPTQFFEFVGAIAGSAADGDTVRLPPALMQHIVAEDVAAAPTGDQIGERHDRADRPRTDPYG